MQATLASREVVTKDCATRHCFTQHLTILTFCSEVFILQNRALSFFERECTKDSKMKYLILLSALELCFTIPTIAAFVFSSYSSNSIAGRLQNTQEQSSQQQQERRRRQQQQHLSSSSSTISSSSLFGIREWRDTSFDKKSEKGVPEPAPLGTLFTGENVDDTPREICLLSVPYEQVLLKGQTRHLRLYEDRFVKLFDRCMEHHSGVVALGLSAKGGIIQTVPLCEIEEYNRMEGFGIFVAIRAVGRAHLDQITQHEPFLTGVCREISDATPSDVAASHVVARKVEKAILQLSSLETEHPKATAMQEKLAAVGGDAPSATGINVLQQVRHNPV